MHKTNAGFYYLEILIALLLTQWMVGGLLFAQVKIMHATVNVSYQAVAVNMGEVIAERLTLEDPMSAQFIVDVQHDIKQSLPSGRFELQQNNKLSIVSIYWNGMNMESCAKHKAGENGCYRVTLINNQKAQD